MKNLQDGDYPAELPDDRKSRALSARSIPNIVRVVMGEVFDYAIDNQWLTVNRFVK
jgi:hypothetical protein